MFFPHICIFLSLMVCSSGQGVRRVGSRPVGTKYGSIRGLLVNLPNRNVGPVEVFLGVPYASPPTGLLRFMPPVNPSQWRGVRTADRYGPVCPQRYPDIKNETESLRHMPSGRLEYLKKLIPFLRNESEDCLYLNVYCPAKRELRGLPVIVFIHGDSYEWSSGNPYDGTVLAGFGEVIVITLNYRLGILGFLPAMETTSRGNYGLMDQIAALRWVQENIAHFGGDPRNVTLLGHGFGASCAHLLMFSPRAKGLFHRVVLQSGSAFSPWAIAHEAMTFTRHLARKLGCPVLDHPALVRCMRLRPISEIMRVQLLVPEYLTAFGPIVDGIVIPAEPEKLLLNTPTELQNVPKIDVLIGVTRIESFFYFGASEERYGIEAGRRDRILRTLVRNLFTFHLQEIFLTIVNEYTDWARPVQHPVNILDGTVDALSDALVVAPLISSANILSKLNHRTFLYVFNYPTEASDYPQRLVCVHGEDIPYLFGAPLVSNLAHFPNNYSKPEIALSEAIMLYWTNFAKYGDPNVIHDLESPERTRTRFERFVWPLYDSINQKFLSLAMKPKIRDHYHAHRLSFWLSLIPKLHRQGVTPGVATQHHLLDDHDNPSTYDGIVRQGPVLTALGMPPRAPTVKPRSNFPIPTVGPGVKVITQVSESLTSFSAPGEQMLSETSSEPTSVNVSGSMASSDTVVVQKDNYMTALRVTIIVGCSLLILNLCVFAGVYHQRSENRAENALREESYKNSQSEAEVEITPAVIKPTIIAPPPSPDLQRLADLPQFIPPPPTFVPTQTPPGSPNTSPTYIPLQETSSKLKSSLTQEGQNARCNIYPPDKKQGDSMKKEFWMF
ncbi:neuroligin-4, X-linked isoform X2 [Parasteatoda tepidariorum]|uniref:neuroligin-4, X-linked isoform X2 n=1 Tax=Parasteatoda tepidariorum TaxID=114398 RepID=UPI00077FBE2B|nr:neuroligin-4, X-linked isoform X2 [Parasteatoda tepidariorum]